MRFPFPNLNNLEVQANFEAAEEALTAIRGGIYGPYIFRTPAKIKPEEEVSVTLNHGLRTTPYLVLGGLHDGFFSAEFSWRWEVTASTVKIIFHNLGSHEDEAVLVAVAFA